MAIKKKSYIGILSAVIGIIYMNLALPSGLSCIDALSNTFDTVIEFIPIQFFFTLVVLLFFNEKIAYYIIVILLSVFWFLIHRHDFIYRKACWSTYLDYEILPSVAYEAKYPMVVCLAFFTLGYFYIIKKTMKQKQDKLLYFHLGSGMLLIGIFFFIGQDFIELINNFIYSKSN